MYLVTNFEVEGRVKSGFVLMSSDAFGHKTLPDGSRQYLYFNKGRLIEEVCKPDHTWSSREVVGRAVCGGYNVRLYGETNSGTWK
jgi:hypothetical protein